MPESAGMKLKEDEQRTIPNTNLSHYRIVSKIGAGGMGE